MAHKNGRLDVERTAVEVFEDLLDESGLPSAVLRDRYDLSMAQWGKVKLAATKLAADHNQILGYHQQSNRFRVIKDDCTIAVEMMEYTIKHIGQEGATLREQARGAHRAGIITKYRRNKLRDNVSAIVDECEKGAATLRRSLKDKS